MTIEQPAQPDLDVEIGHVTIGSSNVKSVGYDPESRTLEIEFHGGGLYRYGNVDSEYAAPLLGPGPHRDIATKELGGDTFSYGRYIQMFTRQPVRFPYVRLRRG